ncbi:hypothetical protein G6009_00705 [Dietzia sp. SLG510A3-30A2]|nr:hypothetical protein [Dietzia sp. SLG510A3-30A2]
MANTISVGTAAEVAVATLYERLGATNLVHRDFSQDIVTQKLGDTMNVRRPTTFEAKSFNHTAGIEIQDVNEGSIPVVLNEIADVSFELTDSELTLKVDEFADRFIAPAIMAIAQKIDRDLIAHAIANVTAEVGTGGGENVPNKYAWSDHKVLIDAGYVLNSKNVPLDQRYALIGAQTEAEWRGADSIQHADKSGSTEALRQGSVGQNLHGFDAFWTQNVAPVTGTPTTGDPTTEVGVAFHRDAFTFTNAALYVPADANASVQSFNGLTLRVIQGYDVSKKKTVFSVDCLYGVSTLDPNKAVLVKGADAA